MFAGVVRVLLRMLFGRSLPPVSQEEKVFLDELLVTFRALPLHANDDSDSAGAAWGHNMNRLRELVLNRNPRKFLQWDVVADTMFVFFARYLQCELRFLRGLPDWDERWCPAIRESWVGQPTRYALYPPSSGNLIHHAYHVAQFEKKVGKKVDDLDFILEFGGGYGNMCRLIHTLGFRGRYVVFDLPPFSALQTYFLKASGLLLMSASDLQRSASGVTCLSDVRDLSLLFDPEREIEEGMFLATWSLSESPLEIRGLVFPFIARCKFFLIAYQRRFGEVDNETFFEAWKATLPNVLWDGWSIDHMRGSRYLVGAPGPSV